MANGHSCIIGKQTIPEHLCGLLKEYPGDTTDSEALQKQIAENGYVLLRDVLNRDEVLSAREEIFMRLEEVGEIRPPAAKGIATGVSRREELGGDLGQFWRSVSEGSELRRVTHGDRLGELVGALLGEQARAHEMMYLRPCAVGYSTPMHFDYPFFAGRSKRIHTAWVPLGDITMTDGPLVVVEGSHRFDDLVEAFLEVDYEDDHSNETVQKAAYDKQNETDPISFVEQRGARFMSTNFNAGDVMIFSGLLMHGSLDNCSSSDEVRLSCDVRYQPASDPADDNRYFGSDPRGSNGGGYGDMRGAKPLA